MKTLVNVIALLINATANFETRSVTAPQKELDTAFGSNKRMSFSLFEKVSLKVPKDAAIEENKKVKVRVTVNFEIREWTGAAEPDETTVVKQDSGSINLTTYIK